MAKKVAELLAARRHNWRTLDRLCDRMESSGHRALDPESIERFTSLYRSACADLALADAYQLPQETIGFLHQLVARAHNQLYRSRRFNTAGWGEALFVNTPRLLFRDGYFRVAAALFFGLMFVTGFIAYLDRDFATAIVDEQFLEVLVEMHSGGERIDGTSSFMTGFYVGHNTGIGLRAFVFGLIFGVGGLLILITNACQLGVMFGYVLASDSRDNFLEFVTAHGPFELTAIALATASGMRIGFALVFTGGLTRGASVQRAAAETVPLVAVTIVFFVLAAMIEGFLSPSGVPYVLKLATAVVSTMAILGYIVVLGWPRPEPSDAIG